MKKSALLILPLLLAVNCLFAQVHYSNDIIKAGAERTEKYISKLQGQRIALNANQTCINGEKHLLDSLVAAGINIFKVFGPAHGFRGNASNGSSVGGEVDPNTGVKIISQYGKKKKPSREHLADVDILIYDIQD